MKLLVTIRAARDIERIAAWWSLNRPSVPGAVRKDLETALALLLVQPDIGAPVTTVSGSAIRRFHLDRLRYWVYYRVRGDRLELLSVWHSSRVDAPGV